VNKLPEYFLRAVSCIQDHFTDHQLSIPGICKEAYLRTLFHQNYGKTPTEYITELRLEHARNLISCGASVEAAAGESGFSGPKYFARVVKKHFGCTPRNLRSYGK
jgi:two-component system response regulator YesN